VIGRDYDTFDDFIDAYKNRQGPLDVASVLGKIYSIEQLRLLAETHGIGREKLSATPEGDNHRGISQRYDCARAIAGLLGVDQVSDLLSLRDHELYFPAITYFRLTDSGHQSCEQVFGGLRNGHRIDNDFTAVFRGLLELPGPICKLESIRVNAQDDILSLLFSCNRILLAPDGIQGDYRDYFVCRVPVLVRFLFLNRLLEISMPFFSEVFGDGADAAIPQRYQVIVMGVLRLLSDSIPVFAAVDFTKVTLWLETKMAATDMGWRIDPVGTGAEFDFTQGVFPLQRILTKLSSGLEHECKQRGIDYPLAGIDLYSVFRALKEQSYTETLVLHTPLGGHGGGVKSQTLYGPPNTGRPPIMMLQRNNKRISGKLREAVALSQTEDVQNPYDLGLIFKKHDT
jgi:hypothetical protein